MLLSITAPQDNDRNPQYMEKVFSSILDSIDRRDRLQLAYGCYDDAVGIFCRFADHLEHQVVSHIKAKYPNCLVKVLAEDALDSPARLCTWSCSLRLVPEIFPILRHKQFQDVVDGTALRLLTDDAECNRLLAKGMTDENRGSRVCPPSYLERDWICQNLLRCDSRERPSSHPPLHSLKRARIVFVAR